MLKHYSAEEISGWMTYPADYQPIQLPPPEILRRWMKGPKPIAARLAVYVHAPQYGARTEYCAWLTPGWRAATRRGAELRHYLSARNPGELRQQLQAAVPCLCPLCVRRTHLAGIRGTADGGTPQTPTGPRQNALQSTSSRVPKQ